MGVRMDEKARKEAAEYNVNGVAVSDVPRILIIDDDPQFATLVRSMADFEGVSVDVFRSIEDIGGVSRLQEYDVAVINYFLDSAGGFHIAQFLDVFFRHGIDVVLMSKHVLPDVARGRRRGATLQRFVHRGGGVQGILEAVQEILRARRFVEKVTYH